MGFVKSLVSHIVTGEYSCDRCGVVAYTQATHSQYTLYHVPFPEGWKSTFGLVLCPACTIVFNVFLMRRS